MERKALLRLLAVCGMLLVSTTAVKDVPTADNSAHPDNLTMVDSNTTETAETAGAALLTAPA